ncbi:MAG: D-2-hydroxyacid dehydrogenase [bacterium]|nr:D-2-hydroxyacid dehydrogenase [bacterium]
MKIVVLDGHTLNPGDNPWDAVASLGELQIYDYTGQATNSADSPADKVVERSLDADIIVTNKAVLSADVIAKLPNLKFIAVTATGYNVVDIAAARSRGIPVSNVPEYGTDSVAQFTFALILELVHHVALHSDAVHAGEWGRQQDFCFWKTPLTELAGKTLAIIGYGKIGHRVGEIAEALGMKILTAGRDMAKIREIIAKADIVTLHCPLTDENKGMVNREFLAQMKPTAFLINAARGGLVVEQDLADALNSGKLAGAAVDVVSAEPIKLDNPLIKAKNCIITPHIAWATLEARQRLMQTTADNIRAFQEGKPVNVINS